MSHSTDNVLRTLYTTVFSQKFSPDGEILAASDNFGNISLYRLSNALSTESIDRIKLPFSKIKAHRSSLYSLESSNEYLICAPLNEIKGWKWKDIDKTNNNCLKPAFSFKLNPFSDENHYQETKSIETNSLLLDVKSENKRLLAGCGTGEIYNFDFETCKLINRLDAHTEAIYQIVMKTNQNEIMSSSENGEIKTWDLRTKNETMCLKPYENSACSRPNLGRHINCLAVDDDNWLITGGGPRLSMWHLRSMKPLGVLEFFNELYMPNVCKIHENSIISGGNSNHIYIHTFESKLKTEINTTVNCIYDISVNNVSKLNNIMSVAGSSSTIDICSNFSYRALTLNL